MVQEVKTGLTKKVSKLQSELEQAVRHRQNAKNQAEVNRKKALVGTAALLNMCWAYQSVRLTLL